MTKKLAILISRHLRNYEICNYILKLNLLQEYNIDIFFIHVIH